MNVQLKVSGDFLTKTVRDMWNSLLPHVALKCLNVPEQLDIHTAVEVCVGTKKCVTSSDGVTLDIVNDDDNSFSLTINELISKLEDCWLSKMLILNRKKFEFEWESNFGFSRGKSMDVEKLKNNIKSVCVNLKSVYPLVGKSLADLPYDKVGVVFSNNDLDSFQSVLITKQISRNKSDAISANYLNCERNEQGDFTVKSLRRRKKNLNKSSVVKTLDKTNNCWVSPVGKIYSCEYGGHSLKAKEIIRKSLGSLTEKTDNEILLEKRGWMKMSNGNFYRVGRLTPTHKKLIVEYMMDRGVCKVEINLEPISLKQLMKETF